MAWRVDPSHSLICIMQIRVWDLRRVKAGRPEHVLTGHTEEVFQATWSPHLHQGSGSVLASSGSDRRVFLWDLNRVGDMQTDQEKEEGPPELLFIHGILLALPTHRHVNSPSSLLAHPKVVTQIV
jgi:WD40 repeat protein